eukprot:TRINITY_DN38368_c0_g1_i1.p1 TRINITY_DN38368_c0_g1~~TRINITY_DN38368_c0_g1_i1.p1  ORF type:complete len:215 (+),score=88.49 TRINITY_DN38368_c0_g1_i1:165-809(+)
MPQYRFTFLPLPGLGELVRLSAVLADVELEENTVDFTEWKEEVKPRVEPRQLPLLEVDGTMVGQTLAQFRYFGRLAGLYPEDPLMALNVDEFIDNLLEIHAPLLTSMGLKGDEKRLFRESAGSPGGTVYKWVEHIDSCLAGREYAVGDSFTLADVAAFVILPSLRSGFFDGIPPNCLTPFENIAAHHDRIARLPKVKAYYANAIGPWLLYQPKA